VFAVEVTDTGRAKTGLDELVACTKQTAGDGFGYAFESHYVLLAETQALADQYAQDAAHSSLADESDFTDDMDSLGDLGVATMWVNVSRIFDAFGGSVEGNGLSPDDLGVLKQSYQRAAATFRFESDSAEIATSVYGDTTAVMPRPNPIVRLPDSTVFAMSESGGAQRVRASWDDIVKAASSGRVDVRQQVSDFEAQTGLTLPDDLETLFGDNLLFAVDSFGLTAESLQAGDPSRYDIGARFTTDPAKLSALYDKIVTFVRDQGGGDLPLAKVMTGDGMALATNDGYAKTLAGLDGDLGSSDDFTSVIDDASSKEFVLYFDFDAVEAQVVDAMRNSASPPSAQVIDSVTALRAVGITGQTNGHHTLTTVRVSVND
jgi:hypothetical protein